MAQKHINTGTPNGQNGDFVRDAFTKSEDNFIELYDKLKATIPSGFDRVFYTADEVTIATGTYFLGQRNNSGTITSDTGLASVPDDSQVILDKQTVGTPVGVSTSFPSGVYAGQVEYQVEFDNSGEQRFRLEFYKAQADGTPIDSGILSEPVGVLGVRPALRAVSQIGNAPTNTPAYLEFQGVLDQDATLAATERVRTVFICEKIGTTGTSQSFTVYFGNLHTTYTDTPILRSISDNMDVDTGGSVTGQILQKNANGVWQGADMNLGDVGAEKATTNIELTGELYRTYGDDGARTGVVMIDDSKATIGYSARVIHNDTVEPTITTDLTLVQYGVYLPNERNDIYIQKTSETEITVTTLKGAVINGGEKLPTSFTLTQMSQNVNNFTILSTGVYTSHAWADNELVGDGYIEYQYLTTNNLATFVGFSTSVRTEQVGEVEYLVQIGGDSNIYRGSGEDTTSSINLGVPIVADDILRVERVGSDILIKRSQDGGTIYSTLYTYAGVGTANLKVCVYGNGLNRVINNVKMEL